MIRKVEGYVGKESSDLATYFGTVDLAKERHLVGKSAKYSKETT